MAALIDGGPATAHRRRQLLPARAVEPEDPTDTPIQSNRNARVIALITFMHAGIFVGFQLFNSFRSDRLTGLLICFAGLVSFGLLAWRNSETICALLIGRMSQATTALCAFLFALMNAALISSWSDVRYNVTPWFLSFSVIGVVLFSRVPLACATFLVTISLTPAFAESFHVTNLVLATASMAIAVFVAAQAHSALSAKIAARTNAALIRAKAAEAVLRSFEDSGDNWFWEISNEGVLTYASPKFCDFLGERPQALIGRGFISILSSLTLPGPESGIDSLKFYLTANLPFREIVIHLHQGDQKRWLSLSGGAIIDERKQVCGHSGICVDISAIREAESRARQLADYDSLTGLANRAHFQEILRDLVAKSVREHAPCSLFFIDLDRFKIVNDTLGHPVGDELLRTVAYRIDKVIGGQGQAGRLGGDEFVIVIPHSSKKPELAALASRLIAELSAPYFVGPSQVLIGASIGIATGPHDGTTADDLMRHADLALYASKEGGRGTYRFYDASMRSIAEARRTLEMDLREALARDELSLVYQPILDLKKKQLAGFEALLRWNHPVKGSIAPDQFVPIAEESALILQLGEWVLRTALADAAQWPSSVRIAINLSPAQLQDKRLSSILMSALANSQIDPGRVELEITESVFLHETPTTSQNLDQIQSLGVRLALDDFGTGYSSLGYLQKVKFDKIKIDRSFVRFIDARNRSNEAIIRAVVALASSYGIITTAEGAETANEVQALYELGCDQVQGFAYGHPMKYNEASAIACQQNEEHSDLVHNAREPRLLMIKNIQFSIRGRTYQAVLRNLSSGGAMLETETRINLGESIDLHLPSYESARGSVCWIDARRVGIMFDEAIQIENLGSFDNANADVAA